MAGKLIAVVGPSGVGKDTVIDGVCSRLPAVHKVQRTITRKAEAEDCISVSVEEFRNLEDAGAFCLSWQSHGLSYGIPKDTLTVVQQGNDAIVNLSRGVLETAQQMFPDVVILSLTAPKEILAKRLAARGRENEEDIAKRLAQADFKVSETLSPVIIDTSGSIDETLHAVMAALHPVRA